MAVPKYHDMYTSVLKLLSDGLAHTYRELIDYVAKDMNLSDNDRNEMLPSGTATRLQSNVGWAGTYLKKAGLVESPTRGSYKISQEGQKVLKQNAPSAVNRDFLTHYDSFNEFVGTSKSGSSAQNTIQLSETPTEEIARAFKQINSKVADELLEEILKQTPAFFERLVVLLLEKMGYGGSVENAGIVTGKSGDEGIDGIIKEDKLGFNLIHIQAKRWDKDTPIGRPEIHKFVGALTGQGATKGVFITTAKFSKEARSYVEKTGMVKIILIDGDLLANLMIEHNIGVNTETRYVIKKVDTDFFNYEI